MHARPINKYNLNCLAHEQSLRFSDAFIIFPQNVEDWKNDYDQKVNTNIKRSSYVANNVHTDPVRRDNSLLINVLFLYVQ